LVKFSEKNRVFDEQTFPKFRTLEKLIDK